MTFLLGIDIGTSSAKAVLLDVERSQIQAVAGHEYLLHRPAPGAAEQDPADWWAAVVHTVRQVVQEIQPAAVAGLGLSGQMHGTVLLGPAHDLLHPAIIWADQRSAASSQRLMDAVGKARYVSIAGTQAAAGFMAATLAWLDETRPGLLEAVATVLLPKDYVRYRLTGRLATDVTDAAGTGLFDVARRAWATEIVQAARVPTGLLPPLLESSAVAGPLTPEAASELELPAGLPVVAGCADQPAQALGSGLIAPGQVSLTIGSGGQVFVPLRPAAGQPLPGDERVHVFNHAVPGTWYVLGAILSAGLSLRWLRDLTGLAGDPDAYSRLSAEAAATPPGAEGLIFLPYLGGERTPHMDPLARGAFVGLSAAHTRGHLARAVMEGVSFAMRQALEVAQALGGTADGAVFAGGAAGSAVWRQIQSDVLGLPLRKSALVEQAGVGAALLAGIGGGLFGDFASAVNQIVRYEAFTEPAPGRRALYDDRYQRYCELYPLLREDFHQLAGSAAP